MIDSLSHFVVDIKRPNIMVYDSALKSGMVIEVGSAIERVDIDHNKRNVQCVKRQRQSHSSRAVGGIRQYLLKC